MVKVVHPIVMVMATHRMQSASNVQHGQFIYCCNKSQLAICFIGGIPLNSQCDFMLCRSVHVYESKRHASEKRTV